MEVKIATNEIEILTCFNVLVELRPHLTSESFLATISRLKRTANFNLAFVDDKGVKAVAGFRVSEWLYTGQYLEIEDLITTENERSKGYGGILFDWLCDYASANSCNQLRLVSGVARESAHRFYLRKGMTYEAKYFSMNIK